MLYGKYLFSCVLEDDAFLPPYKGSTFRGIFGHALKKVVCALKNKDCHECLIREKCVYAFVFESMGREDEFPGRKRIASPPHPYVIEPPEITQTSYKKGDRFDFNLLLFGKANDYLPYFIFAFEQVGEIGIGKRVGGRGAKFSLENVTVENHVVYSSKDRKICYGQLTQELLVESAPALDSNSVHQIELILKTPLRLKYQNHLEAMLPFHVLTRAMLRRISSLQTYYGNGEPHLDYRGLVKRAEAVKISNASLEWFDWKRYSNRQDQAMLMGGIVGEVAYEGDLTEFVPLLRFCEKVHLGKQTSFGLGKIKITEMEP